MKTGGSREGGNAVFLQGLAIGIALTVCVIGIVVAWSIHKATDSQLVTLVHSQVRGPRWSRVLRLMVRWSEGELRHRGYDVMQARAFGYLRKKRVMIPSEGEM